MYNTKNQPTDTLELHSGFITFFQIHKDNNFQGGFDENTNIYPAVYGNDKDYSDQLPDLKDESTETNVYAPTRRNRPNYRRPPRRRTTPATDAPVTEDSGSVISVDFNRVRNYTRQIVQYFGNFMTLFGKEGGSDPTCSPPPGDLEFFC